MEDNFIGKFLDNRYEILEKIGTGGMAVVYKARCHRLNRLVAVKILKAELAQDSDFRRRFHAESQAVAMLSHPNIVAVYDVSHSDNVDYIVMELIEGITLKQYINRKGVLNWKEALHFSTQITKALSHAHSRGIIHRDIKPHNIMILKDGSVKVADFGIARLLSTQNTLTQEALGSVHYISPEQAKGGHVDARSDIYSVGVVMYEMLTSRLPFEGDSAVAIAIQHINSIPLMPREINPDIPLGLEAITMHAMEPNMNLRYSSADALLYDLEEFRKNPSILFNYALFPPANGDVFSDQTRVIPTADVASTAKPAPARARIMPTRTVNTKEAYKKNRNTAKRTSVLIGIVCILVFLIVVFLFMYNAFLKDVFNPEDTRVTVPNFVGQYIDAVEDNSEYTQYFTFEKTYVNSDTYPEGYIMSQDIAADRQMTPLTDGITIKLEVSGGTETIYMPDLLNVDYREAKIILDGYQLDLVVQMDPIADEEVTVGYVLEQYPTEGEPLVKGGTVYLTYSSGPEVVNVEVPSVMGLSESQAIARLESYDLSYKITYVDDENSAKGEVIFQSYTEGESVPIHTEVAIQVSNGPAPTPSPTPTPENTPTPTPAEG